MTTRGRKAQDAVFATTTDLINYSGVWDVDQTIETTGFTTVGDGGGAIWKLTGNPIAASQTPALTGDATCSDANGNEFSIVSSIDPEALGAISNGVSDETLELAATLNALGVYSTLILKNTYKFTTLELKQGGKVSGGGSITGGKFIIEGVHDVVLESIHFDYGWVNSGDSVIYIHDSEVLIQGNTFNRISNQFPILFEKSTVRIIRNEIDGTTSGIENVSGLSSTVSSSFNESVMISENIIRNIAGSGINLISLNDGVGTPAGESGWERGNTFFGSVSVTNNIIEDITGFSIVYRGWFLTCSGNQVKRSKATTLQGGSITCVGNVFKEMITVGLDFGNVSGGNASENIVSFSELAAIEINSCFEVNVSNNIIAHANTANPTGLSSAGIWVHGSTATSVSPRVCDKISIHSNQISKATGSSLYGISIEDADTKASVTSNQVQGSGGTSEIRVDGLKVVGIMNANDFSYDNAKIIHVGAFFLGTF